MKNIYFLVSILFLMVVYACSSVEVYSDYDKATDFTGFKTYAFYKKGIDRVEISDLDKKRILRAIERELKAKGMVLSDNPDLLVNIFTKSREKIDVYNNSYYGWYPWYYGYGGYYGPGYGFGYTNVSSSTEGTLFIDLIDARKKELAWQGIGVGILSYYKDVDKKEARINEFVTHIMTQYPPQLEVK
ncbi:DUF4136 domain-containing protein [Lutimonas sp.]|uniref:DUF4136 domain-containing protein n=1 Tax=Lutimonas sp. TaxID=1872403 RepID=UPI003D9B18A2